MRKMHIFLHNKKEHEGLSKLSCSFLVLFFYIGNGFEWVGVFEKV